MVTQYDRKRQRTAGVVLAVLLSLGAGFAVGPRVDAAQAGTSLTMRATAYGPSAQANYPYGATDYFGRPLVAGDIAVDPSVIPLNTCVTVTGYQSPSLPAGGFVGDAVDEGGAIVGNHIDIYMAAGLAAVSAFGIQPVHVTVLGPSNPHLSGTAACAAYSATPSVAKTTTGSPATQVVRRQAASLRGPLLVARP